MSSPYPLLLEPILLQKVWGGDRLARLGKPVRPREHVGECWEVADLAETSASGAGGGAQRSVIAVGHFKGRTLHDALSGWGKDLVGAATLAPGGFPLLVKYLDARENLSVQVHPSPAYVAAHPGANLKTECWYIVDAEPGAKIYKGVKPGVTREVFARHAASGEVAQDLVAVPAVRGECHNLPSGTVHALGAGVLVAEVQTPSDTTFRVYDWGRSGRALHLAEALECIEFAPPPPATSLPAGAASATLARTEFFTLDEFRARAGKPLSLSTPGRCAVLMLLAGEGILAIPHQRPVMLRAGGTAVIPAALGASVEFEPAAASTLLRATLPGG